MITVSIVSHGHGAMVSTLIGQLQDYPEVSQIILTLNIPEEIALQPSKNLLIINNSSPKGFGANHNFAFAKSTEDYFCVLNPDIRFMDNPFKPLIKAFIENKQVALAAPSIINGVGDLEDSARYFPTLWSLVKKILFKDEGRFLFSGEQFLTYPDWVAGMFMLFSKASFSLIGGFNERYFLYYEDVDICKRLRIQGYEIALVPFIRVIHDAQRASRKNLRHLRMHLVSAIRYTSGATFAQIFHKRVK